MGLNRAKINDFTGFNIVLTCFTCTHFLIYYFLSCPTAGVTRWWVGRGNAIYRNQLQAAQSAWKRARCEAAVPPL